jgi:hypothetical protein
MLGVLQDSCRMGEGEAGSAPVSKPDNWFQIIEHSIGKNETRFSSCTLFS